MTFYLMDKVEIDKLKHNFQGRATVGNKQACPCLQKPPTSPLLTVNTLLNQILTLDHWVRERLRNRLITLHYNVILSTHYGKHVLVYTI